MKCISALITLIEGDPARLFNKKTILPFIQNIIYLFLPVNKRGV